jgi:TPR repeat protein
MNLRALVSAIVLTAAACGAGPVFATDKPVAVVPAAASGGDSGVLNPQGLSVQYWGAKAKEARFDPKMCVYGVFMDKTGQHAEARRIFKRCAEHGDQYAMPWMSFLDENGYDRPSDPVAAAKWDKKLAELGNSIGQFNYGLDLLRGHGVAQDFGRGKAYIDKAAAGGDATARELSKSNYDWRSVTPTADLAHYGQPEF